MKHKWHKEIKAWADGAEIEYRGQYPNGDWNEWTIVKNPSWDDDHEGKQYRIKPQPKETQYLYVYSVDKQIKILQAKNGAVIPCKNPLNVFCIGKIKLEVDYE